ncbi:MAG: Gfo/Idh/MocA family oxidoreductase [Acidobacteriota bacterium]
MLLCGSNYGRAYLPAFQRSAGRFSVGGLLARGSSRSMNLATSLGVPLFHRAADVPAGAFQMAVVALPGRETRVARDLLEKALPVLLEHPRRVEDLETTYGAADRAGAPIHVNGHFADLTAPSTFIDELSKRRRTETPWRVEVTCQDRALYAALDILDAGLPLVGAEGVHPASRPSAEFRSLELDLSGDDGTPLPCRLDVHAPDGAVDGSARYGVDVRIAVYAGNGRLTLESLAGPVVWVANPQRGARATGPLWQVFSSPVSLEELNGQRVEANLKALERLASDVEAKRGGDNAETLDLVGRHRTLRIATLWGRLGGVLTTAQTSKG